MSRAATPFDPARRHIAGHVETYRTQALLAGSRHYVHSHPSTHSITPIHARPPSPQMCAPQSPAQSPGCMQSPAQSPGCMQSPAQSPGCMQSPAQSPACVHAGFSVHAQLSATGLLRGTAKLIRTLLQSAEPPSGNSRTALVHGWLSLACLNPSTWVQTQG